jgi:hypothetical protein
MTWSEFQRRKVYVDRHGSLGWWVVCAPTEVGLWFWTI